VAKRNPIKRTLFSNLELFIPFLNSPAFYYLTKQLIVDNESNQKRFDSVYSNKVRAGKRRTYFFDVRQTKGNDYYLTLTESTKRFNGEGYERHKIFLYKEDFNRFLAGLEDTINHVKTELMPDYDYEEYTRRHEEYEKQRAADEAAGITRDYSKKNTDETTDAIDSTNDKEMHEVKASDDDAADEEISNEEISSSEVETEDDISW